MAGRISLELAKKQGATLPCSEFDIMYDIGRPKVTRATDFAKGPGWITNPKPTRRLMNYWSHGRGAAKIRWFTDGSMRRCIRKLRKYFPQNPGGLCANLHKRATGEWPRGGVIPS